MVMAFQAGLDRKPARRRGAANMKAACGLARVVRAPQVHEQPPGGEATRYARIYLMILYCYDANQGRRTLLRDLTISQSAPYR